MRRIRSQFEKKNNNLQVPYDTFWDWWLLNGVESCLAKVATDHFQVSSGRFYTNSDLWEWSPIFL